MHPNEPIPSLAEFWAGLELFFDPILCGAVAGLTLGFLGIYIVLRRMVFVSAGITQAAGLGVALSFYGQMVITAPWLKGRLLLAPIRWILALAALNPLMGAFVFGLVTTWILSFNVERFRITRESLLGFMFIAASAASLLVGDRIAQESHDIQSILFGTAVLVSKQDLYATLICAGITMLIHYWFRRGFIYASFDEDAAKIQKIPVRFLNLALLSTLGVMVSVTTRALGALPVFAFSVLPALTALNVTQRLGPAMIVAPLLGAFCGMAGYVAAFFLHFPVGGTQALVAAICCLLGFIFKRLRFRG